MKIRVVRTELLLGILRDQTERSRDRFRFFFDASGFRQVAEVMPVRDCGRRVRPGLIHQPAQMGKTVLGRKPRDRFEPREPGAAQAARGGQEMSVVLP